MKRLLFLLISLVYLAGCKKDTITIQEGLIGTWELRESSGSLLGYRHNYQPGNGNTITFLDSSHFKSVYVNEDTTTAGGGIYQISTRSDCDGTPHTVISYPPNLFYRAISYSNDTLHIDDYCVSDAVFNTYVKIK